MNWINFILIYILFWWVTLFLTLPIGVKGQAETGDVVPGSERGAPVAAQMKKKLILTTILSVIFYAIFQLVIYFELLDITDFILFQSIE